MNSDYRKIDPTRNNWCLLRFFRREPLENEEEVININDLVSGLNVCVQGIKFKMDQSRALAQKYVQNNDTSRARIHLKLYHYFKQNYEQLLQVFLNAKIIKETAINVSRMNAVQKSFEKQTDETLGLAVDVDKIKELMNTWNQIVGDMSNIGEETVNNEDKRDFDDELEELRHIELSYSLPNITHVNEDPKPKEKEKEENNKKKSSVRV